MTSHKFLIYAFALLFATTAQTQQKNSGNILPNEPVIGLPCEGCEAVFEGLPDSLSWRTRIAPEDEPGEPMRITGTVYNPEGNPAPGIIVYAYHTDARGIYPKDPAMKGQAAYRYGRLRGWVKTDSLGRYRFDTIRPASYPNTTVAVHVHMHVIEPGCCTYYISSIKFRDDPYLSANEREKMRIGRGGNGLVMPVRDENGIWQVIRDIQPGRNLPGYSERQE